MSGRQAEFIELADSDHRYAREAYEFLCNALSYTQKKLSGRPTSAAARSTSANRTHVSGQQLLDGIREFAIDQYGRMAYVVLEIWGVRSTSDFGQMVYKLIEHGHWTKSDDDFLEHFDDYYNFQEVFIDDFAIEWEED